MSKEEQEKLCGGIEEKAMAGCLVVICVPIVVMITLFAIFM